LFSTASFSSLQHFFGFNFVIGIRSQTRPMADSRAAAAANVPFKNFKFLVGFSEIFIFFDW
jgi:hypothetical protein